MSMEIKREILPEDVLWEMDWSDRNAQGERLYPDKPEKETEFEQGMALALLLANEVVFVNDHWWEKEWPEAARKAISLNVLCNDVFAWGCSDVEEASLGDLRSLYDAWLKDTAWGGAVWCIIRRRQMPQRPVEERLRAAGVWDVDALCMEHRLRPNHYDGVSSVLARRKYAVYSAWASDMGRELLPFDAGWWQGWKDYTSSVPGWHSPEWEAEDRRLIAEFQSEAGYEPLPGPMSQAEG